jgi:hypothetical protein
MAGGLFLGSDNGKLFTHKLVHKCRFPYVRFADNIHKARLVRHIFQVFVGKVQKFAVQQA